MHKQLTALKTKNRELEQQCELLQQQEQYDFERIQQADKHIKHLEFKNTKLERLKA